MPSGGGGQARAQRVSQQGGKTDKQRARAAKYPGGTGASHSAKTQWCGRCQGLLARTHAHLAPQSGSRQVKDGGLPRLRHAPAGMRGSRRRLGDGCLPRAWHAADSRLPSRGDRWRVRAACLGARCRLQCSSSKRVHTDASSQEYWRKFCTWLFTKCEDSRK
ncbi:hypothetical protein MRX96_058256 [Rhipicephalus microplus]